MRSIVAGLVLLALSATVSADIPTSLRIDLQTNPDGTHDTRWRLGDKPPGEITLGCNDAAAPSLQGLVTGNAYSADVRQYFFGTAAATATLSVVTVSGDSAATNGWAISSAGAGNNLTNAGSNAGVGGLLIRGTTATNSVDCSPRGWSYAAAPGGDSTAPSIPGNLIGTPGSGNITWTFNPSTDPHDGTNNGSGVKNYDLELNGAVTIVTDPSPGLVAASTEYIIGSPTGTNSTSQAGGQWTITCAGTGIDGTSDQLCMRGWAVTGDFRATTEVTPGTSVGSTHAPQGLMARGSSAPDAQYVAVYQKSSAQSQGVEGKVRTTIGGPKTNLTSVVGTNTPRCLGLERTGTSTPTETWTLSYSVDCVAYTQFEQRVNVMPATVIVGPFATSMSAGNSNTATFNELSISTRPRLSYTQTTSAAATARVRARDLKTPTANVSAYSATVSATPDVASGDDIKWYPGHYVIMSGYNTWTTANVVEAGTIAGVTGIKLRFTWKALEPTRGNYDFSLINQLLALCQANGLKLFIEVQERNFNTTVQDIAPTYLATESGAGGGWYQKIDPVSGAARGYIAKMWLPAVMDRLIALHAALAAAYDSEDDVAAIGMEETSPGHGAASSPDYTSSAWATQIKRFSTATTALWSHTPVTLKTNSLSGQLEGIINHAYLNRSGVGGPDMLPPPHNGIAGDRIIRGIEGDSSAIPNMDYRGKTVISYDVQTPSLGGKEGTFTPTELADHCILTQGCHFFSWIRSTSTTINWATHIKPYLQGSPRATVQTCPENLGGNCVTN